MSLVSATPGPAIPLGSLSAEARRFWTSANHDVLWGWKRDTGAASRLVYFSTTLEADGDLVVARDAYFCYEHRTEPRFAARHAALLEAAGPRLAPFLGKTELSTFRCRRTGLIRIRFEAGTPAAADRDRLRRLKGRRPRLRIAPPAWPTPRPLRGLEDLVPFDLYAGSGVSYEAGLPTLCDMHEAFGLDRPSRQGFVHGGADLLPLRLRHRPLDTLARFCLLHVAALDAPPSAAQRRIARLHERGVLGVVMSDNVDNMLGKVGVPFLRTRGSGVFNERFAAEFRTRTLVVVGVAADRRQIVQQARARRMRIVVVNPCRRVSPRVQHLNYLRQGDVFFKTTADRFFFELSRAGKDRLDFREGDVTFIGAR